MPVQSLILSLILSSSAFAADIEALRETKNVSASVSSSKPSGFRPKVDWSIEGRSPMEKDPEGDDYVFINTLGVQYKPSKKHKLALQFSYLNTVQQDPNPQHQNKGEVGDANLRWVDSRFKGLWDEETDLIFTHKLYIPLRERSLIRTEVTHYKLSTVLSRQVSNRWSLITNFVPTFYHFRQPNYYDVNSEKFRPNIFYDVVLAEQALYSVSDSLFLSVEAGWQRREFLKFKNIHRRDDAVLLTTAVNFFWSDNVDIAAGVATETPTAVVETAGFQPFEPIYSSFFFEMNMALF